MSGAVTTEQILDWVERGDTKNRSLERRMQFLLDAVKARNLAIREEAERLIDDTKRLGRGISRLEKGEKLAPEFVMPTGDYIGKNTWRSYMSARYQSNKSEADQIWNNLGRTSVMVEDDGQEPDETVEGSWNLLYVPRAKQTLIDGSLGGVAEADRKYLEAFLEEWDQATAAVHQEQVNDSSEL